MEYANWAFMTQEDHDAAAAAKSAVNAQLAATQHMQAMCDYSLHNTVPALPDGASPGAAPGAAQAGGSGGHSRHASAGAVLASSGHAPGTPVEPADSTDSLPQRSQSAAMLRHSADSAPFTAPAAAATASVLRPVRSVTFVDENTGHDRESTHRYSTARSSKADTSAHQRSVASADDAPFPGIPAHMPNAAYQTPRLGGSSLQGSRNHAAEGYGSDPHVTLASDGHARFTCRSDGDIKGHDGWAKKQMPDANEDAGLPALTGNLSPDDRDSVVQQWLRRNAEVLARLE